MVIAWQLMLYSGFLFSTLLITEASADEGLNIQSMKNEIGSEEDQLPTAAVVSNTLPTASMNHVIRKSKPRDNDNKLISSTYSKRSRETGMGGSNGSNRMNRNYVEKKFSRAGSIKTVKMTQNANSPESGLLPMDDSSGDVPIPAKRSMHPRTKRLIVGALRRGFGFKYKVKMWKRDIKWYRRRARALKRAYYTMQNALTMILMNSGVGVGSNSAMLPMIMGMDTGGGKHNSGSETSLMPLLMSTMAQHGTNHAQAHYMMCQTNAYAAMSPLCQQSNAPHPLIGQNFAPHPLMG